MVLKLAIVVAITCLFIEIGCRLVFKQGLAATLWDILDLLDPRAAEARRLRKDRGGEGAMRRLIDSRRSTAAEVLRKTELVHTAATVTEEVAEAEEQLAEARARLRAIADRKVRDQMDRGRLADRDGTYLEAGSDSTVHSNTQNKD